MQDRDPANLRLQAGRYKDSAAKLLELAKTMERAAQLIEEIDGEAKTAPAPKPHRKALKQKRHKKKEATGGSGRLAEIREFLRENGPATRAEILKKMGLPEGTINANLKKVNFRQDEKKRWHVPDESLNGK